MTDNDNTEPTFPLVFHGSHIFRWETGNHVLENNWLLKGSVATWTTDLPCRHCHQTQRWRSQGCWCHLSLQAQRHSNVPNELLESLNVPSNNAIWPLFLTVRIIKASMVHIPLSTDFLKSSHIAHYSVDIVHSPFLVDWGWFVTLGFNLYTRLRVHLLLIVLDH